MRRLVTRAAEDTGPREYPPPRRWLIGVELARHRNEAKLSLTGASVRSGISRAKLGHLETGRQQQDKEDIVRLLATYGADQREVDQLISLTGRAVEDGWWMPWAQVIPDWVKLFVGLEGLAESEFVFEPIVIPGLVQAEDYAAAVTACTPRVRADHSDWFVSFRVARARRLTNAERPLRLHTVFTEAALRLAVGTPEVRQAQLRHLVAIAERPTVTLQILRPEDGLHTALTGQFAVLDFENVHSIGYVELHDGAVYLEDPYQLRTYAKVAEDLKRVALDPDQSIALIKSMITS